ncbi:hypothetical protein BAE44_0015222 [Dichanthelium oligosanthes]|uniref:Uncharacterized protein n=1 Tax=Dichanthelium oligosanthes TaxID=888268 RepID=A0A1E5VF44_9POAL|nr:hypothetical protein BAE44_0015222 [Dichanthelium oligosanthes]
MACAITRIRPPSLLCRRRLFLALLLLVAVFTTQPSSCTSRPLPTSSNNGVAKADTTTTNEVMTLALPIQATSRQQADHQHHQLPAGGSYQWLLDMKPRGKAPPSAPSKRTN